MTGVTRHNRLAAEVGLIKVEDHLDHATRCLFGRLVVYPVLAVFSYVAKVASHSKRSSHEMHDRQQLRTGQTLEHLNVLVNLLDGFVLLWGPSLAGAGIAARQSEENHC